MLFYLTFKAVSSIAAFLYPGYASYKTLSQRPASEEELERWLMYWSVLGCIIAVEYVAEWLVSWIPFYYAFKTLFLLYLALPQTQGSSYLYTNHLQPFFQSHEDEIDAALASIKTRIYSFVQERARRLWDQVVASMGQQRPADLTSAGAVSRDASMGTGAPPSLSDPLSGPSQLIGGLWRSYGPILLANGAAFLRQSTADGAPFGLNQSARARSQSPPPPAPSSRFESRSTQSVLERRRQLEAELAALSVPTHDPTLAPTPTSAPAPTATRTTLAGYDVGPGLPTPSASGSFAPRRSSSSSSDLRDRHVHSGTGRFEEVEVPSDIEGDQLYSPARSDRPDPNRRTSWFGWGAAGQSRGEYERVKND